MNKRQKLVQEQFLNNEEAVIRRLKQVYGQSLKDITTKAQELQNQILGLQAALGTVEDAAEQERLKSMIQSKVYQRDYQNALKKQVGSILDNMQVEEFKTVSEYLQKCYEDGFIGTMFDLQGQGIPLCFPLDQEAMVRAVQLDSKISQGLYARLGEDVALLKKKITAQVSRGISTGMSFQQVAQQLSGITNIGYNNAIRIARTEGHRIQVQGAMDACYKAKEKGADVVKQWDATLDGATRESHQIVDGEIKELDEKFSNGLMFPGDPSGGAAEVVNCRCALLQRARWALDEDELEVLKERAAFFGLDKAENFEDYKKKYLEIANRPNYNSTEENDAGIFDGIISGQQGMSKSYQDVLNKRYSNGSEDAKKAFNKYVPSDSVANSAHTGTAHFNRGTQKINMNYADDLQNKRGAGTTFFHEHGHYIDFMAAGSSNMNYLSTNSQTFGALLQSDFKEYVKAYKKKHKLNAADAYRQISTELLGHEKHSLSDLMDGISKGKCSGMYGHKRAYWSNAGALEKEAFAHMYEATFDSGKYSLMKQYFPNALDEFERMLKGVI